MACLGAQATLSLSGALPRPVPATPRTDAARGRPDRRDVLLRPRRSPGHRRRRPACRLRAPSPRLPIQRAKWNGPDPAFGPRSPCFPWHVATRHVRDLGSQHCLRGRATTSSSSTLAARGAFESLRAAPSPATTSVSVNVVPEALECPAFAVCILCTSLCRIPSLRPWRPHGTATRWYRSVNR